MKCVLESRVEVGEDIGTIRYIGKLKHKTCKPDEDLWLGIEWDDPSRGKHNGTVEECDYFVTAHPTSGSLIKLSKVNFGHSFNKAIEFKYNFHDSNGDDLYKFLNKAVESDCFIQAKKKRITIEFVGKEEAIKKFSKLDSILNIDLSFSYISHIESDLASHFPKLRELILQKTLLSKWSQFLKIFINFSNLELLNFSENVLNTYDEEYHELKYTTGINTVNSVNYLIMNKCKLNFSSLLEISYLLKNVETLYLMGNELNEESYELNKDFIDENRQEFENNLAKVTYISLEKNKIKNFVKVCDILSLPSIIKINLNQNHIAKIINTEDDILVIERIKQKLQFLSLDFNQFVSEDQIIEEVSSFVNLVDLDFLNNSTVDKIGTENAKFQLIGRLTKLHTLNNTNFCKEVRRDSELLYLKFSVNDYIKTHPIENFDKEKFEVYMTRHHPNYFRLRKKYYDPLEDIIQNVKPVDLNTLKGSISEVTFQHGEKKIVKKFPKSTTFANLRNPLSRLFKLTTAFVFNVNNEEVVTDETKSLDSFSINIIYLKS